MEIKIPGLNKVFNFPNILQYNFIKDEKFEEETLSRKNPEKFKDFTMTKFTNSGCFCKSGFALKKKFNKNRVLLFTVVYCVISCKLSFLL